MTKPKYKYNKKEDREYTPFWYYGRGKFETLRDVDKIVESCNNTLGLIDTKELKNKLNKLKKKQ